MYMLRVVNETQGWDGWSVAFCVCKMSLLMLPCEWRYAMAQSSGPGSLIRVSGSSSAVLQVLSTGSKNARITKLQTVFQCPGAIVCLSAQQAPAFEAANDVDLSTSSCVVELKMYWKTAFKQTSMMGSLVSAA